MTTLAVYLHRLDPVLVSFTDTIAVRWYGLSYIAGFAAAYLIMRAMAKRGRAMVAADRVGDLILAVAIGTVIGGRLGYVLLYKPAMLLEFSSSFPFWDVLALNRGGMASHGGIIGIVLGGVWFARKHGVLKLHVMDLAALSSTVGIFFGRVANFVNGELYGRACDPALPWAVKFPQEMRDWAANAIDSFDPARHVDPAVVQGSGAKLRELGDAVSTVGVDPAQWHRWIDTMGDSGLSQRMVEQTIARLVESVQHTTPTGDTVAAALGPILTPRHPSQVYEAMLEGLALLLLLLLIWLRPRKPGVIGGAFLVGYAAVRIVGEQFRMPDQHIGYELLGLTRGQWLSIGMLAVGIALAAYWSLRSAPKVCGLLGPRAAAMPT